MYSDGYANTERDRTLWFIESLIHIHQIHGLKSIELFHLVIQFGKSELVKDTIQNDGEPQWLDQ